MRLSQLTLRSFRNLAEVEIEPHERFNLFVGLNGEGKTSVLESVSYLSNLRSFRGAKTAEVLRWGDDHGVIRGRAQWLDAGLDLAVRFERQGERVQKTASLNGKPVRTSSAYLQKRIGTENVVVHSISFNPSDHDLVRGVPEGRRAYLDRVLSAEDVEYLENLQTFHRALAQRNAWLRDLGGRGGDPGNDVFHEVLVRTGAWIARARIGWLNEVGTRLPETLQRIAPGQPTASLTYDSDWLPFGGQGELPSLDLLRDALDRKLGETRAQEQRAGFTLAGPHRDDWAIGLGGHPLRGHGSQGEIRSALLALKIREIESFRRRTGHRPILLLDDLSSELDQERRGFLLAFLLESDLQVYLSSTEEIFPDGFPGRRFEVSGGELRG